MGEHTHTTPSNFMAGVSDRLQHETYDDSRPWWETPTAEVIVDLAKAAPFVAALAGITEVLQEGEEPMWAVGSTTASGAFAVAQEWLDSGIEPSEVGDWLRAGCWDPKAARPRKGATGRVELYRRSWSPELESDLGYSRVGTW
jgi:hypothetical protein